MNDPMQDLIVAECKGYATEDEQRTLCANLSKWRAGLIDLLEESNNTLAVQQQDFEGATTELLDPSDYRRLKAEFNARRGKTLFFKRAIESRLRRLNLEMADRGVSIPIRHVELIDVLLNLIELDGIHDDVPGHLHPLLDERLLKVAG